MNHGTDRKVEIADQEGVGLGDGGHDQRQGQDQDLVDVGGVDEAREPRVGVPDEACQ
jgi:hypothetical protein